MHMRVDIRTVGSELYTVTLDVEGVRPTTVSRETLLECIPKLKGYGDYVVESIRPIFNREPIGRESMYVMVYRVVHYGRTPLSCAGVMTYSGMREFNVEDVEDTLLRLVHEGYIKNVVREGYETTYVSVDSQPY